MHIVCFQHPEPLRPRQRLIPAFIPFAGCPGRCIYCAQHEQTGEFGGSVQKSLARLEADLAARQRKGQTGAQLAFYGGTFTALPDRWQRRFLLLAEKYRDKGLIHHVRCSTRPDCIDRTGLKTLKEMGLDMVELGVQSFCDPVLQKSGRGHSSKDSELACALIRRSGLELGLQMLPGLPGHTPAQFMQDMDRVARLAPSTLRIYPCLVIGKTELTRMWERGEYAPWGLKKTIHVVSLALPSLWERGIAVIRIGLAPEKTMLAGLRAGPWHPAMGSICRGRALKDIFLTRAAAMPAGVSRVLLPKKYVSDFWGYRGENKKDLRRAGLNPAGVKTHKDRSFVLIGPTPRGE
ncbi:MAG: elongator complex protein 3 [Desulfonatronovibrionaceae bacterium]